MTTERTETRCIEWPLPDDPEQVLEDLQVFGANAKEFDSRYSEFLESHPMQWVAFHEGKIRVTGASLDEVRQGIHDEGLPQLRVYIRYLNPDPAVLIL